jgi:hypothetical protein
MNTEINQVTLENIEQSNEPPKQFTFDAVYPEDSITENIYAETVFPLVESVGCIQELKTKRERKNFISFRYLKVIMQLYLPMDKQGTAIYYLF